MERKIRAVMVDRQAEEVRDGKPVMSERKAGDGGHRPSLPQHQGYEKVVFLFYCQSIAATFRPAGDAFLRLT